jgi:hypothetical protein
MVALVAVPLARAAHFQPRSVNAESDAFGPHPGCAASRAPFRLLLRERFHSGFALAWVGHQRRTVDQAGP